MKWLVPLFTFVGLASTAFGILGDSEEDLAKHYGKQTKTGTSHLPGVTIRGYNFGNYVVIVGVLNGRAAYETYSKRDGSKISANDVSALMNANASGHTWAVDTGPTGGSDAKPVGTVWFAWCVDGETHSEKQHFAGDRAAVRAATVRYALQRLLGFLLA